MKKTLLLLLTIIIAHGVIYSAPRAKIYMGNVTPHMLLSQAGTFGQDSSVATGMNVVANKTWAYVKVINFGDDTPITNAAWTLQSKPAGSTATLTPITGLNWWAKIKPDLVGEYEVKASITTSSGTKDTTMKFYSATYVGTGGFENIAPNFPECGTCHIGISADIFNRWKVSGHANIFRFEIDSGAAHYSTSCMKCHTVGYDHNMKAANNGFDDKAQQLGWNWANFAPPKPGNWAALKNNFAGLVPFAQIGCESCHGPGSLHATNAGDTTKTDKGIQAGKCGQCHDEPWRHNKYSEWENSMHSEAIYSTSFAQGVSSSNNDLGNCIRCHDGQGYINFTKNKTTNTVGFTPANHEKVVCAACHDPHGNNTANDLRSSPTNTQKLANNYNYSNLGGEGKLCMDCHKTRRDANVYSQTKVTSSHWGPHHNGQADVLLGQNAATFPNYPPYLSGSHKNIANTCVTCHMAQTSDTGTVMRDKVGGHSMTLQYEPTNYDHVKGCLSCHPGITSFEDFDAPSDFDGDGLTESWRHEVEGLEHALAWYLPPLGDSVSWQLIGADTLNPNHLNIKKAYYNFQVIEGDKSLGMHNPFFTVGVLQQSILALGYPIGVQLTNNEVPNNFSLTQNYPNPFNPSTSFKFAIPQNMDVSVKIFDITGKEIATLVNGKMTAGTYTVNWNGNTSSGQQIASGVYFYKMTAGSFTDTKKMILVK